jgi:hypothetical protein
LIDRARVPRVPPGHSGPSAHSSAPRHCLRPPDAQSSKRPVLLIMGGCLFHPPQTTILGRPHYADSSPPKSEREHAYSELSEHSVPPHSHSALFLRREAATRPRPPRCVGRRGLPRHSHSPSLPLPLTLTAIRWMHRGPVSRVGHGGDHGGDLCRSRQRSRRRSV